MGLNQTSFTFTTFFRKSFELIKSMREVKGISCCEASRIVIEGQSTVQAAVFTFVDWIFHQIFFFFFDDVYICHYEAEKHRQTIAKSFSSVNKTIFSWSFCNEENINLEIERISNEKEEKLKCHIIYMNDNKSSSMGSSRA